MDFLSNISDTEAIRLRYNSSLSNIDGLSNLGSLVYSLEIIDSQIEDVDSLSNLTSVGAALYISGNNSLQHLDGLSSLEYIGGVLVLQDNEELTNIDGLSSLQSIAGEYAYGAMTGVHIHNNPTLITLDGFSNTQTIIGGISLSNNSILNSITGLFELLTFEGDINIEYHDDLCQTQVDYFSSLFPNSPSSSTMNLGVCNDAD